MVGERNDLVDRIRSGSVFDSLTILIMNVCQVFVLWMRHTLTLPNTSQRGHGDHDLVGP